MLGLRNTISEAIVNEKARTLSAAQKRKFNKEGEELASIVLGNSYGTENLEVQKNFPNLKGYRNDANIKGGLFSVGNAKLSPDTLIINFTSGFHCPAANYCPMGQKTCYAVNGENRLKGTLSKNLKVERIAIKAWSRRSLDKFFDAAESYIREFMNTDTPIRWVRFNEAGDFINQDVLDAATEWAKHINEEYGVKCMAYTAMNCLNFSEASKVMAINASTKKVLDTFDDNATKRNFFGVDQSAFDYSFIEDEYKAKGLLGKNAKSEEVPLSTIKNLRYNGVLPNDITTPILEYGKWGSGEEEEGYYYICPCSFWKDRKNQVEYPYCARMLKEPPYNIRHLNRVYGKNHAVTKELRRQLNKVESPCGISCAVCHDTQGGIIKGTSERCKNYAVLTGIHGSGSSNYNPTFARLRRMGEKAVWSDENPSGLWRNTSGRGNFGKKPSEQTQGQEDGPDVGED